MSDEGDFYVSQLREVFNDCDRTQSGTLGRGELRELCCRLQVEEHSEVLMDQLFPETDSAARISFDEFKEGFVAVLSQAVDSVPSSEDEKEMDQDNKPASPKLVKEGKRYGRRSKPDFTGADTDNDIATDFSDDSYHSPRQTPRLKQQFREALPSIDSETSIGPSEEEKKKAKEAEEKEKKAEEEKKKNASPKPGAQSKPSASPKPGASPKVDPKKPKPEKRAAPPPPPSPSKSAPKSPEKKKLRDDKPPPYKETETFEAEGQMNKSMTNMDTTVDPMSEEEHLRAIWKELGVGTHGYLTIDELAAVCAHIGMEDMNKEELHQLFDNLDSDGDRRVSFSEFMSGLFQHGPAHSTTPTRPVSSQKKPRLHTNYDGASTPSAVTAGSGLFSQIDPEGSGYAQADRVVDYWDRLGLHEGSAILRHLDFDLHNKLNLSELSFALDQELSHADAGNASYQAAVLSYQHEMKYVKSNLDHVTGERDKLKQDLHEANTRIAFLVKEGDERHQNIEKTKEREIENVERRYQDQIKSLQAEAERANEKHLMELTQQRKTMENVIIGLKEEETRLKDKVTELNRDLDRLEGELLDSTERLADTERLCTKQQRELDGVSSLHRKIEELESNKDMLTQEQQHFYDQKIEGYQHENKDLRDRNDELTIEVENLHQQIHSQKRRQGKTQKSDDSMLSHRETEMLSSKLRDDIAVLKSEHEYEMAKLHHRMAHEHKAIEEKYKKELHEIEKGHKQEKNRLLQDFRLEKDQMLDDFELQKADVESKLRRDLTDSHTRDMDKCSKMFKSEKHQLELKHAEERNKLSIKFKTEYEDELQVRLDSLKSAVNRQRETDSNEMGRQMADVDLQRRLQQEEMSLQFSREMASVRDRFNEEKARQAEIHRMEIEEFETMLAKGEEALKGQLRVDFNAIIETAKEDIRREEKIKLMDEHRKEKDRLIEHHELEQARISEMTSEAFTEEKREMEEKYKDRIFKLEEKLRQHEEGLRRQLEDEYEHRVSDLKNAFKDEMMEIEEHKRMLENEIDELRHTSHLGEQYKKELDEIKNRHSKLQDDHRKLDNKCMEMMVEREEAITAVKAEKTMAVNELSSKEKESNHRLAKEKENLEESVSELKRKLDEYNTALEVKNIEAENMKNKLDSSNHENEHLKHQLQHANDKLAELATSLSLAESEHCRDMQDARQKVSNMVDMNRYNDMAIRSAEMERRIKDLEAALDIRSKETNKMLINAQGDFDRALIDAKEGKQDANRKLEMTRGLLQEQVEKLKIQLERNTKSDLLVQDLYKENAQLMKALQVTEERQKQAERKVYKLEEKCAALQKLLNKIVPMAME